MVGSEGRVDLVANDWRSMLPGYGPERLRLFLFSGTQAPLGYEDKGDSVPAEIWIMVCLKADLQVVVM